MAILNTQLNTSDTTVYTSSGETLVACLFLCNTHTADVTVSVHVVPNGQSVSDTQLILKDYNIPAGDTLTFEWEKLILDNGDYISATADVANKVSVTVSHVDA